MTVALDVDLKDVLRMLDDCADGHKRSEARHRLIIKYKGFPCINFPTGEKARDRTVKSSKVRMLVRQLQLSVDCAEGHFPNIGLKEPSEATPVS